MYQFFLDGMLLPVTPEGLTTKISNKNKTISLINEGEINILKDAGLTEVEFDALIPSAQYSFTKYESSFKSPQHFLSRLESLKTSKAPFRFIVIRDLPGGKQLHGTNMQVSLEEYDITESADEGFDSKVSIKLKQYRPYELQEVEVLDSVSVTAPTATREIENSPAPAQTTTYTVVKGDTLWKIAKHFYGDGNQWRAIYEANKSVIGGNPDLIYPGQVLTIPNVTAAKTATVAAEKTAATKTASVKAEEDKNNLSKAYGTRYMVTIKITGKPEYVSGRIEYRNGGTLYKTAIGTARTYTMLADKGSMTHLYASGKNGVNIRVVLATGEWKALGSAHWYVPMEGGVSANIVAM